MWKKIKPYILSCLIPLITGGLSALLTMNGMKRYSATAHMPPLSPPMWLFPIVWSVLYILMGISSALIFEKRDENKAEASAALKIYGLQLVINFFWSIIFFNLQNYLCAFIWLILLLFLIIIMIFRFYKISHTAAYLQIPYVLWIVFAGYLTWMVYMLN